MNWFNFLRKRRPPPTYPEVHHDEAAIAAIDRAQESLDKATIHLAEIQARRARLDKVRRENHFAPAIHEAFKRRKSE